MAAAIFEERGVTESMVSAVMDQMYLVLHEEKTIWKGRTPEISIHNAGTKFAYVLMRFGVEMDLMAAAELSWRLTERIVEKGLDFPGLVVSFAPGAIGVDHGEPIEA